ncbi:MAG: SAM hydrolase/SAM-dependent halogenase family protein [Candidatus Thorarchaeota archaeon]|jgi:S-adenosylmethionine hydrolase
MIVLLTDFGESEYTGVMRGVIYSICPDAQVVDLTHSVPAQSIREGAWILLQSYKYFPKGTVFVSVVDPGVGTARDAVVVVTENYIHVGPDNGLLYPAAAEDGIERVYRILIDEGVSKTFHGRDIFAKAAAYHEAGTLGVMSTELKPGLDQALVFHQDEREGEVVRRDKFGNIITNILPAEKTKYLVSIRNEQRELPFSETYEDGPEDGVFLITSSYDTLEIAAKNRPATDILAIEIGERITIE